MDKVIRGKPGRPRYAVPRVRRHISFNANTLAEVSVLLEDPFLKAMKYGSLSALVNILLEDWVRKQRKNKENI
jgi:hypothetical protein